MFRERSLSYDAKELPTFKDIEAKMKSLWGRGAIRAMTLYLQNSGPNPGYF